ncbi:conjugal transfer protein [Kosakonia sp. YIM B13611]|uniref:conjugal transfer protein n=1 Tax=unclassified Kosakonia TaxID=2632876 RepID=UPI0036847E91
MNKALLPTSLLCAIALFSAQVIASDACEVVLCMYGKTTGSSGGNHCHTAERAFFDIVKRDKNGFLPGHTADARKSFLLGCKSVDPDIINKIISKFGRIRG